MMELAKAKNPFIRKEMSKADAVKYFEKGDEYKLDLLEGLEDGTIVYTQGDFTDLCRGPHTPHWTCEGQNHGHCRSLLKGTRPKSNSPASTA